MKERRTAWGWPATALVAAGLLAAGCDTGAGPTLTGGPAPIRTDAAEYRLRPSGVGLEVDIPYVYTNRTGWTVYLENCQRGFALWLDRKVGDEWRRAWSPVQLLCLSEPIVIRNGTTFVDTLHVWGALPGHDTGPAFETDDPSGVYRIVWGSAYSFYADDAYSSQLPLDARISNEFLLHR